MILSPSDLALLREFPASTEPPRGLTSEQRRRIEDLPWGLLRDGRRTDLGDDVVEMADKIATLEAKRATHPHEVQALARFYTTETDQEFWRCLACGCEWPRDVVTACANCHGPKVTP